MFLLLFALINANAQRDPIDPNTDAPICGIISNGDLNHDTFPDSNNYCFYLDGASNVNGWGNAFNTPDWILRDQSCDEVVTYFDINMIPTTESYYHLNYNLLPLQPINSGSISIHSTSVPYPTSSNISFNSEGVYVDIDNIQPGTNYILSYHKIDGMDINSDGITPPESDQQVAPNFGLNVYLSEPYTNSLGMGYPNVNRISYSHNPSSATVSDNSTAGNLNQTSLFIQNSSELYKDNSVDYDWSQTVIRFQAPPTNNTHLIFWNEIDQPLTSYTNVKTQYRVNIDKIQLIEDRLSLVPHQYTLDCEEVQTIGESLCSVANMRYQWWDVSVPGADVQLTGLFDFSSSASINPVNPNTNYNVEEVLGNGSQIKISGSNDTVQLELRRVFPATFSGGLLINNQTNAIDNLRQIEVEFGQCSTLCNNFIPDIEVYLNENGCPIEFLGVNLGDDCEGQTYLWETFIDVNNDGILQSSEFVTDFQNISFNETDFDFSLFQGNFYIQFTISTSSGDYSETVTIPWPIDPACFADPCPDCEDTLESIFIQQERPCGLFQAFVPSGISDCYRVDYYINSVPQGELPEGTTPISFTTNGSYIIETVVVDITTTPETGCAKRRQKITIDCLEDCPECSRGDAAPIYDAMWNNFTESERVCGEYSFIIPRLDNCFTVQIDWGDDIVETSPGGSITHNYDTNDSFNIALQVLVDGEPCDRQSIKKINVDCFNECTDCSDESAILNLLDGISNTVAGTTTCGAYEITISEDILNCFDVKITLGIDDGTGYIDLVEGVNTFTYTYNGDFNLGIYLYDAETGTLCNKLGASIEVNCFGSTICIDDPVLENVVGDNLKHILNGILNLGNGFTGWYYNSSDVNTWIDITNMPEVVQFMQVYNLEDRLQNAIDIREIEYNNDYPYYTANITNVYYRWITSPQGNPPKLTIDFWNQPIGQTGPEFQYKVSAGYNSQGPISQIGLNPTLIQEFTNITINADESKATYEYIGIDGVTYSLYDMLLPYTHVENSGSDLRFCWFHDLNYTPTNKTIEIKNELSLFPNPANREVAIKFTTALESDYEIFIKDMTGRIINQSKNKKTVDVSRLPAGIYFVNVLTNDGVSYRKQLIIKK